MPKSRRAEYDKLIESGNYPDFLTGDWTKDKDAFIQMQFENEMLEIEDEDFEDQYYEDDYIGY